MSSAHDLRTFASAADGGPVKFPIGPYVSAASYFDTYAEEMSRAAKSIEPAMLERAAAILVEAYLRGARTFSCGNGGLGVDRKPHAVRPREGHSDGHRPQPPCVQP